MLGIHCIVHILAVEEGELPPLRRSRLAIREDGARRTLLTAELEGPGPAEAAISEV